MNEEQQTPPIEQAPEIKGKWKHHFTTVTPFSKALAMLLFIALPFVGFWLGMVWGSTETVIDVAPQPTPQDTEQKTVQETEDVVSKSVNDAKEILLGESIQDDLEWRLDTSTQPEASLYVSGIQKILPGSVWAASREVPCAEEYAYDDLTLGAYKRVLEDTGWRWEWVLEDTVIQGMSAGGPMGDVYAVVRVVDGEVHVAMLTYHVSFHGTCEYDPEGDTDCLPHGGTCPYTYTYEMFISEPTNLDQLTSV